MQKREINLFDLMVEILLHWRGILLVMLLGGICIGGLGYVRSYQNVQKQNMQEQQNLVLSEGTVANINMAVMYECMYRSRLSFYKEDSILMRLDPCKVWKAYMTFLINADDLEQEYNIVQAYENILCSGGLFEYLGTTHGISTSAVSEIVALENESPQQNEATDSPRNNFRLTVVHYDEAACSALARSVADYIAEQERQLQQDLGAHSIVLLEQSQALVMDTDVLNRQKSFVNDTISFMTAASNTKDGFTEAERRYYDRLIAGTEAEGIVGAGTSEGDAATDTDDLAEDAGGAEGPGQPMSLSSMEQASASVSPKYILFGIVLGVFGYAFVIFIGYIMNNRLRYTDDLCALYEVPMLGRVPETGMGAGRILGCVDRWILRLRSRGERRFTPEEALRLTATAVKIAARKQESGFVTLIGCGIKGDTLLTCQQIKNLLDKEGIRTEILDNILYDAESMDKLNSMETVVLVEKAGSTLYTEIDKECGLLRRQGIVILGGIVQG